MKLLFIGEREQLIGRLLGLKAALGVLRLVDQRCQKSSVGLNILHDLRLDSERLLVGVH